MADWTDVPPLRHEGTGQVPQRAGPAHLERWTGGWSWVSIQGAREWACFCKVVLGEPDLPPWTIRVNAPCPVTGVAGLLKSFMGAPDMLENRVSVIVMIPPSRLCEPEDMADATV